MDAITIFNDLAKYFGEFVLAGTGISAISFWIFKLLGTKWVDARFAEQLQELKAKQDEAIRHVQSSIDREIHRAKKLYDREFDVLSDCWAKLSRAYDSARSTISERYADFRLLNGRETDALLKDLGLAPK